VVASLTWGANMSSAGGCTVRLWVIAFVSEVRVVSGRMGRGRAGWGEGFKNSIVC
jgi:hypothetical protein